VTLLTLTPTAQPKTGASAPLNLTALLAAGTLGSNTGVSFANSGKEVLYIQLGASASTDIVAVGATVEGQPVTAINESPTVSAISIVGPYDSDEDEPGGLIQVTFGTPANVTGVALVQNAGAY
jgi:hypothetical protein